MTFLQVIALSLAFLAPDDPGRVVVRAEGIPDGATLQLSRVENMDSSGGAMFAQLSQPSPGVMELRPVYRLSPGQTYEAELRSAEGVSLIRQIYSVPKREPAPNPEVVSIHPGSEELPANVLKFYLTFSVPMRQERAIFERIHLEDSQGRRVEDPWRRQELWSDDGTRLTLWIHPGRVKQGVNLRKELGPVLHPGKTWSLVLEDSLLSQTGVPLENGWRRTFRTLEEDRARPLPENWELSTPAVGSRQALRVQAGESLDHALLERYVHLEKDGDRIPFQWRIEEDASAWWMIPEGAWTSESHELVVGPALEDLAGNTPERLFDTDLDAPPLQAPKLRIPFTPTQ